MKIHAIGGYNEVGKNMTALEIDQDVLLFDCGLFLPAIVGVEEREKIEAELIELKKGRNIHTSGIIDKINAFTQLKFMGWNPFAPAAAAPAADPAGRAGRQRSEGFATGSGRQHAPVCAPAG